jgi:hypothetical protein
MDDAQRDALRSALGRLQPVITDGKPMMIVRPDRPSVALAVARSAIETQDVQRLSQLPKGAGGYTFVGYLAKAPRKYRNRALAINEHGDIVDEAQPGDSFITAKDAEHV